MNFYEHLFFKVCAKQTCQYFKLYVIKTVQRNKNIQKLLSISCENAMILKNKYFNIGFLLLFLETGKLENR